MKIGGSLGKWSNEAKGAVRDVGQMADQFYKNTIGDITDSLGNISQCLASLDKIRIRVMERTIEYHTAALRVLIRSNYVEQEIIETVWHMVKNDIRRSPEPAIYHLPNPKSSVGAKKIDIASHVFPKNKYPSILVHGMGYNASLDDAYSFYRDFEDHVDVFSDSRYADHDIYLVSYDTELTDESDSIIRAAIELLLGMIPGGDLEPLVLGVFWRELERRASLTGDYIFPFLKRIKQEVPTALGFAVTHSLGCFTLASASQKLLSENRNNKIFSKWLCMAAALPANAFTETGSFSLAPLIAGYPDGPKYGTSVWFSRLDLVLNIAYTLANRHLAMGVSGPLQKTVTSSVDVTNTTKEDHYQAYFKKLSQMLKELFGI